jgi:hypothetical protein
MCDSVQQKKTEGGFYYLLAGRTPVQLSKANNTACETGHFTFDIVVNRDGKIIEAKFNQKNSDPISEKLKAELERAVLTSLFYANIEAPEKQKGSIGYKFEKSSNDKF